MDMTEKYGRSFAGKVALVTGGSRGIGEGPANPGGLSGSYTVHGHDADMKLPNGSPYYTYRFTIEQDGKALTLTTKEATISVSREQ